jgi:hypothetical protein
MFLVGRPVVSSHRSDAISPVGTSPPVLVALSTALPKDLVLLSKQLTEA